MRANRFSLAYRPGTMNAHSWYSQIGHASTTPATAPTLSRSMNWSNGPVPSRVQEPSAVNTAREDAGREQYGSFSSSPRLGQPKKEASNQM